MKIRKIDAEGDWMWGKGMSSYAVDEAAIEQNVKTRILSWVGDCFFDMQAGIDYKNRIDVRQQQALADDIRALILQSFGVWGAGSVDVNFVGNTRAITIGYNAVETIFGEAFSDAILQDSGVI